jgi:glutamine synthetase
MMSFIARHGLYTESQQRAAVSLDALFKEKEFSAIRLSFADVHGILRGKEVSLPAARAALENGVPMVGTLLLKDTSHRTAWPVFRTQEAQSEGLHSDFWGAGDVIMVPLPETFRRLPWAPHLGWMQCQAFHHDGCAVALDPRTHLCSALDAMAAHGFAMKTGLEIEFYVYRLVEEETDPARAQWPARPPRVAMVHPGYNLLTEQWLDRSEPVLEVIRRTCASLDLPLRSLEIELGPSQFEAVFDPDLGLVNADRMVLFRSAMKQALYRAGFHVSFVCRPPFETVMSSGWHLHQSLVSLSDNANALTPHLEGEVLSERGRSYLAGLLQHAQAYVAFAVPSINGYARYQPNALAPVGIDWGTDNRGTLCRVINRGRLDPQTRIENRMGEPIANPYLFLASQAFAGVDGILSEARLPPAATDPYAKFDPDPRLPAALDQALDHLEASQAMCRWFGEPFVHHFLRMKRQELARCARALAQGVSQRDWEAQEYFGLF